MGARWYAPDLGAFLSRDTLTLPYTGASSLNRYAYGNANPLGHTDKDGHLAMPLPDTNEPQSRPRNPARLAPVTPIGQAPSARAAARAAETAAARGAAGVVARVALPVAGRVIGSLIPGVNVLMWASTVWEVANWLTTPAPPHRWRARSRRD